ncbi:response regulator [Saccharibacillus sp. JS10]|uniref:response regulator transcription factor n=1 Tax=Saccharibacillus sp. JS10 TaxID=2950552 RepID=UPI00210AF4A0|nr:response regulator [Saccharibacillus sp. JS10]MCQ4085388.1 response regulator [Saccharibacillus sp. JS10]
MYKVLLIDDEPLAIEGLKWLIDWEKYDFHIQGTYDNGEDALEHIRRNAPDLVVTDIRMPGLDGLQFIEAARKIGNTSTLFVIASGYDDFDYARRAVHLGVSGYLTKPLIEEDTQQLLARLSRELHKQKLKKAAEVQKQAWQEQLLLQKMLDDPQMDLSQDQAGLQLLSQQANYWYWAKLSGDTRIFPTLRERFQASVFEVDFVRWIEKDRCGFVIGISAQQEKLADDQMRIVVKQLEKQLSTSVADSITLSIGCQVNQPQQLWLSVNTAEIASVAAFFNGSKIGYYADAEGIEPSSEIPSSRLAQQIAEIVEKGSEDEVDKLLTSIFKEFRRKSLYPYRIQAFAQHIVLSCAYILKELGGDPEPLISRSPFCGHSAPLSAWEQTLKALKTFCLSCRQEVLLLRECSGGGVQGQVANFLRCHYTETFTIQELAERFYVHPTYLGQSFTRKYGVGIAEFVHTLRIEEACRLLQDCDMNVCTIAEQVGYKDYRHFLKQFEKRTGKKPAHYRTLAYS